LDDDILDLLVVDGDFKGCPSQQFQEVCNNNVDDAVLVGSSAKEEEVIKKFTHYYVLLCS